MNSPCPQGDPRSGDEGVNEDVQCNVQGAETRTVQSLLVLLCFRPPRAKEESL